MNPMKKLSLLMLCLIAFAATPAVSQEKSPPAPQPAPPALTRFDLDFPGGTPAELAAAIQKAMGHPLNVIVPSDQANLKLPPLKLKEVDVAQLFRALQEAASMNRPFHGPMREFGFKSEGRPTNSTIWYFYVDDLNGRAPVPKISRVYLLTPYLDRGLTVDDITTAIQTGWKMLGYSPTPELSFHKETKLLIAVGDPNQLETIDRVLSALNPPGPTPIVKPEPPKTKE
jgi:hypothetical protein